MLSIRQSDYQVTTSTNDKRSNLGSVGQAAGFHLPPSVPFSHSLLNYPWTWIKVRVPEKRGGSGVD